jgi:hypothetical protein
MKQRKRKKTFIRTSLPPTTWRMLSGGLPFYSEDVIDELKRLIATLSMVESQREIINKAIAEIQKLRGKRRG